MTSEFCGLEQRLDELKARTSRLEDLSRRPREEFDANPDLRAIAERNFEVAIQCCIDMANRILALEGARKPRDYYDSFMLLAEVGVVPADLARSAAPMAGFRNVLAYEYSGIDWDQVYESFGHLGDLCDFAQHVARWLEQNSP
jgi:uncharacterized protein YutE (UPF0331/DUF86 family)